jgi:predicted RecA/RadA family phage recombinase
LLERFPQNYHEPYYRSFISEDFPTIAWQYGAAFDAIGGADVEVALEGIWELPKAAVAIARGAPAFWDAAAGSVAADIGTSNALIGGATEARGTSDLTIRVRLNGDSVWGAAHDDHQSSETF